jgi:hypothetical protein
METLPSVDMARAREEEHAGVTGDHQILALEG